MTPEELRKQLKEEAARVENYLADCLALLPGLPAGLRAAMDYSLLAGGKRLRPVLCLTFARAFGKNDEIANAALPFACAIECIHTYSLIHDDLPAMDDDDMRRGRPSNHKQFDEATAILAGDALLTDAFAFMASVGGSLPAERVLSAIACMATAAGGPGMVGGQFLDMQYTLAKAATLEQLRGMHAMKTGALITASCLCGAILGGADTKRQEAVAAYGKAFGAAFQIMDDVLDQTGDAAVLGKPIGSDAANEKPTYPGLIGLEKSRDLAREEAEKAIAALPDAGSETAFLHALARYVVARNS
ncbi:polyprenyl synthetase family protein [Desulfovibrio sp. OttesenSCG-928-O18]|nr:polyprenyl synthetase family protein [Desulfovibrio sp. OttesenSCG-928-O18]